MTSLLIKMQRQVWSDKWWTIREEQKSYSLAETTLKDTSLQRGGQIHLVQNDLVQSHK